MIFHFIVLTPVGFGINKNLFSKTLLKIILKICLNMCLVYTLATKQLCNNQVQNRSSTGIYFMFA